MFDWRATTEEQLAKVYAQNEFSRNVYRYTTVMSGKLPIDKLTKESGMNAAELSLKAAS